MAMANAEDCRSTQLIDCMGVFDINGLNRFIQSVKLAKRRVSYAVVAIMGPQSSGKSTLLNNLFRTDFVEMDELEGRSQTTKGIWMAKAVDVEPLTIVLDIEGNDGQERGEDQTFEKQSAMFALAIADIVLINIWCNDIGREAGAGKPLLRTVFQVMVKLFTPRKTTLLFIIRDKSKTPLEKLEMSLINATEKIWMEVPKPEARKNAALSDFFNVKVTALPHYEKEEFKEEVARLKKLFHNSIAPGGIAGDRKGVVDASTFSLSAQKMWNDIRENKDLDLPAHKVTVDNFRCDEIVIEISSCFCADKSWLQLEAAAKSGQVSGFGKQLSSILETFLSKYDKETEFFDERVRVVKRKTLESNLLQLVRPAYETLLDHLLSISTQRFETELDKALSKGKGYAAYVREYGNSCMFEYDQWCADAAIQQADWSYDSKAVRVKLLRKIKKRSLFVRESKLSEIVARFEKKLSDSTLEESTRSYLEQGKKNSWPEIRKLLCKEIEDVRSKFRDSISVFKLDEAICQDKLQKLEDYGTRIVEKAARDTAKRVLLYMESRFSKVFNLDPNSKPRRWNGDEDIDEIVSNATSECVELLSVMAAIRLDEQPDDIESRLVSSFLPIKKEVVSIDGLKLLDQGLSWCLRRGSASWDKVSPDHTIITPSGCANIWKEFLSDISKTIIQAMDTLEAYDAAAAAKLAPRTGGVLDAIKSFMDYLIKLLSPQIPQIIEAVSN